jgi:hypothetical protein
MRIVWNSEGKEEGMSLLDVSYYALDEQSQNLQVHMRRGFVVNIPASHEASEILRKWFHSHYRLEKQELLEMLAREGE